jgi:hypothetical protein
MLLHSLILCKVLQLTQCTYKILSQNRGIISQIRVIVSQNKENRIFDNKKHFCNSYQTDFFWLKWSLIITYKTN